MMSQKSKNHCVEIEQHPWVRSWAMEEKIKQSRFRSLQRTTITFLIKVNKKIIRKPKKKKKKKQ
jgi:hypothetical protein